MTEIKQNYEQQYVAAPYSQNSGSQMPAPYAQQGYGYMQTQFMTQRTARDEFIAQHRKNGLTERLFNGIKNLTGLGIGSKRAKAAVEKAEKGEISEDQAKEIITKYRKSQANSAQIVGDALSMGGFVAGYVTLKKLVAEKGSKGYLEMLRGIVKKDPKDKKGFFNIFSFKDRVLNMSKDNLAELFKHPGKISKKAAFGAFFFAGITKWAFGLINRIGSKEFQPDKKDFNGAINPYDKAAYEQVRAGERKKRHGAGWRNLFSGMINGAAIPVMAIAGGIVGVPVYFTINSLNRYFIGNHVDDDKSFKSYMENIKNNGFLGATLALGVGIPAALKLHSTAIFDKNSRKAVDLLKHTRFAENEFNTKSTYEEISEILLNDKSIAEIIAKDTSKEGFLSRKLSEEDLQNLAQELNDRNFFAAKFKQISNDGSALARILKEDCKPTRTYKEAQAYIDKVFGKGVYTLDKNSYCLGVGTVAETYFARKGSQEVCIKALKEGMNADKIKNDKDAFIKIIDNLTTRPGTETAYTEAEKTILKKNVENLADGVLKEIDLANEFKAAEKLAHDTQYANVVKGIEVKDNIYVMERANGISLESLMNLNEAYALRTNLKKMEAGVRGFIDGAFGELGIELNMSGASPLQQIIKIPNPTERMEALDNYIKKIEAKTPSHGNIMLEPEDLKNLISEYQQVLVEQYNKINKNGKVIHGDIHPGNIFINVDALRSMDKPNLISEYWTKLTGKVNRKNHNVFTLIDTGNIIELSKEQSLSLLNLTSYIEHGNYKKIAEYVLQGVEGDALGGHTKEEATQLISDQLKKCFTDTTTPLDVMTNDNLLKLTSGIMKKYDIIPNDTQLNLNKAMQSANNSYEALVQGLFKGRLRDEGFKAVVGWGEVAKDPNFIKNMKKHMEKAQEKENLRHMSMAERNQQKKMEGNLKPNQVEYHIYRLKQGLAEGIES